MYETSSMMLYKGMKAYTPHINTCTPHMNACMQHKRREDRRYKHFPPSIYI